MRHSGDEHTKYSSWAEGAVRIFCSLPCAATGACIQCGPRRAVCYCSKVNQHLGTTCIEHFTLSITYLGCVTGDKLFLLHEKNIYQRFSVSWRLAQENQLKFNKKPTTQPVWSDKQACSGSENCNKLTADDALNYCRSRHMTRLMNWPLRGI